MKLRTFTAATMPDAIALVREAMGEEAIIISSREMINGTRGISVTAAIDGDDPIDMAVAPVNKETAALDELRLAIQDILHFHNLPEPYIAKMLQTLSSNDLAAVVGLHHIGSNRDPRHLRRLALEKLLTRCFNFSGLPLEATPARLMLLGTPGIGKTLSIAKMAARMVMSHQKLQVISTDNKRAGGIEQLQAFTQILKLDLGVATSAEELAMQLAALPADTNVLIDTAGCNPYDHADFRELKTYASTPGIEPVLALAAGGDSMEAIDMAEVFAELPLSRLMITQADSARRFGGVLGAAATHNLSFCNINASSSIIDPLQPADAALLAQMLLKYQLQS